MLPYPFINLLPFKMDESSNSSKDVEHVMLDDADTPREVLGPPSQPGTPCSDLMVPATPLPHTGLTHAGLPMGHISHPGVITPAHTAG